MARIRTIKPEFFTSEDIVGLTPLSRLFYVSLWCEADREGRLTWKPGTLKLRYFPGDNCDIQEMANELIDANLIVIYSANNKQYAQIPSFKLHQVINNRESESKIPPNSNEVDACLTRESGDNDASVEEGKGREGKGREGKGKEGNITTLVLSDTENAKDCPHEKIINLYHEKLPMCPQVKVWNDKRKSYLRSRWREDKKHQSLEFWEKYFDYCSRSEFLTGKVPRRDQPPFLADLEWLINSSNFVKVIEGKYHGELA